MPRPEYFEDDRAESGLSWGFEVESIVLEIIDDSNKILEENLLDLLIQRTELQSLLAEFIEFIQLFPKPHGKYEGDCDFLEIGIRHQLKLLLIDLTNGAFHVYGNGASRKLERSMVQKRDEQCFLIKRITDEYAMR